MKTKLLIIVSLYIQYSSGQNNDSKTIEVRQNPRMSIYCMNEIEKAKMDFENGSYKYYYFEKNNPQSEAILKEKLKTFNIELIAPEIENNFYEQDSSLLKDKNCYNEFMIYLLEKKYSKKFFQKIKFESDSIFVSKQKDQIFGYGECDDSIINYCKANSRDKQLIEMEYELSSLIVYPKDFKYKKESKFSFTSVNLVIEKNGTISNINVYTSFQNDENSKHKNYFEKQIKEFISKSKWKPGKKYGIIVRTGVDFSFIYK